MHLVRVGDYTFNLDNVTEFIDDGQSLTVCFLSAWPEKGITHCAGRVLTGEDAEAMRKYIGRLADDARAQVR